MITTIFKLGNSNAVRIPKHIMAALELKTDDEIKIELVDNQIVLQKSLKHMTIDELFKNYKGPNTIKLEFDDMPVGREEL